MKDLKYGIQLWKALEMDEIGQMPKQMHEYKEKIQQPVIN